ncbi:MAG: serine/threonine-protein kinase [Zavarzinella sp.]
MPIILKVVAGEHAGETFEFHNHRTFVVGRSRQAHISIRHDPYISRYHLVIEVNPPYCRVRDLDSHNGSFLNTLQVHEANLRHGDELRAGKTTIQVEITADPNHVINTFDELLIQQEQDWLVQICTKVENYQSQYPELILERGQLLELIDNECRLRKLLGDTPTAAEYEKRFPELRTAVRMLLADYANEAPDQTMQINAAPKAKLPELRDLLSPAEPKLPQLNGFRILRQIRETHLGRVFHAQDSDDNLLELTQLHQPIYQESHRQKLIQSLQQAMQLQVRNLITYQNCFVEKNRVYLISPPIMSTPLLEFLKYGMGMPWQNVVSLGMKLCQILKPIHEVGLIHRDIQPANIYLHSHEGSESVLLSQFGINQDYFSSEMSGITLLSDHSLINRYSAPELLLNYNLVNHLTDQYSLAAVIYALLGNREPYPSISDHQLISEMLANPPTHLSEIRGDLPEELVRIVHQAMAPMPENRFQSVAEFEANLQVVLETGGSVENSGPT